MSDTSARAVFFAVTTTALVLLLSAGAVLAEQAAEDAAATKVPRSLLLQFLTDQSTFTLIDARSPDEFAVTHIAGAINVPHDATDGFTPLLPSDLSAPIVIYCQTGNRARQLRSMLLERGYTNVGVLKPDQIFWFDNMAVFNCGVDPHAGSADNMISLLSKGKTEVTE